MSFQKKCPTAARVNITLNLETEGVQRQTELPLKLLVMGKFSEYGDKTDLTKRLKMKVNKQNLEKIISQISPKLNIVLPNRVNQKNKNLRINLSFKSYKDFSPDQIVKQVPVLNNLVAMRNLLKELKAHVINNQILRHELEKIIKNKNAIKQLEQQFKKQFKIKK